MRLLHLSCASRWFNPSSFAVCDLKYFDTEKKVTDDPERPSFYDIFNIFLGFFHDLMVSLCHCYLRSISITTFFSCGTAHFCSSFEALRDSWSWQKWEFRCHQRCHSCPFLNRETSFGAFFCFPKRSTKNSWTSHLWEKLNAAPIFVDAVKTRMQKRKESKSEGLHFPLLHPRFFGIK